MSDQCAAHHGDLVGAALLKHDEALLEESKSTSALILARDLARTDPIAIQRSVDLTDGAPRPHHANDELRRGCSAKPLFPATDRSERGGAEDEISRSSKSVAGHGRFDGERGRSGSAMAPDDVV